MRENWDGKIFAKIRHNYDHNIIIEIFLKSYFCDFEHLQKSCKNISSKVNPSPQYVDANALTTSH